MPTFSYFAVKKFKEAFLKNIFKNKCVASLPHARGSDTAAFHGEYAANKVPETAQISVFEDTV